MKENNCRYSKTIVFCENIEHADAMVLKLKNLNQDLVAENPKYIMKITGDDDIGKAELENFTDPNTKYPVIAVTSKLMSTGVDSETCEIIVLDKSIGSMTEFKQTIGRGTRINEKYYIDNEKKSKLHFTILDFRKNYKNFEDPNFDGEPVSVMNMNQGDKVPKSIPQYLTDKEEDKNSNYTRHFEKAFVKGHEVKIEDEIVQYRDENGNLVKENVDSCVKNNILEQFPTLKEFIEEFMRVENKEDFTNELLLSKEYIKKIQNEIGYDIDNFDLVKFIGYKIPPISKQERLEKIYKSQVYIEMEEKKKNIITTILNEYLKQPFCNLKKAQTFNLPILQNMGYTAIKIKDEIFNGNLTEYFELMNKLENMLYEEENI